VAIVTANLDMGAVKLEVGLQVVIECPHFPTNGVVAGVAAILKIFFVRVIFTVAGNAATLFACECLGGMTAVAFLLFVHAVQRESCQVVIEEHRVLPVNFCMATLTLGAQCSLVRIVVQVARLTARHQLDIENWFDVAVITGDFDFLVSTEKFVIRMDVVIEERLFPFGADVATVALIATMLVVCVILQMAGHAGHVHLVLKRIF